jgi:ribonuclease VapC
VIAVDTSALVAVVLGEADAERYLSALQRHYARLSCVSLAEAGIVVESRQGPDAARDLRMLSDGTVDELVAVDSDQATAAVHAWRRFGKGRHPAALNFGDCFAYAVARLAAVPLLFKGDDFTQTDVTAAL